MAQRQKSLIFLKRSFDCLSVGDANSIKHPGLYNAVCNERRLVIVLLPDCLQHRSKNRRLLLKRISSCHWSGWKSNLSLHQATGSTAYRISLARLILHPRLSGHGSMIRCSCDRHLPASGIPLHLLLSGRCSRHIPPCTDTGTTLLSCQ